MPNVTDMPLRRAWPIIRIGIYCVAFGILMGLRNEIEPHWMKHVMAACAFGLLGLAMYEGQMYRRRKK